MATKITHKEAEQLSRNYFEKGFVAVTEDGTGFYMNYSEIPENPSKLIFFHEIHSPVFDESIITRSCHFVNTDVESCLDLRLGVCNCYLT